MADLIIYTLVRGTLRTKPGDDLEKCYAPGYNPGYTSYGKKITGGGTVALLNWNDGKDRYVLYDGGDIVDEAEFLSSLNIFGIDPRQIEYALISHGHPDHVRLVTNLDHGVPCFFSDKEDLFRGVYNGEGHLAQFQKYYKGVMERGLTPDRFTWLSGEQISDEVRFPENVELIATDGETRGFLWVVSRRPLELRYPTGISYMTNKPLALVSDTVFSRLHYERFQNGKPEEALLGITMYQDYEAVKANHIASMERLKELTRYGGLIVPGHDDPIVF